MNNASLSHSLTYVRLLQERTLNDPDFPRHHTRSPPVRRQSPMATTRQPSDTESLPTNCFVHNIESLSQPISDVYYPMCMIATSVHNNVAELICESTHRTLPTLARSHYNINSGIHINLITINNASLSHNSKHVRLLQERRLNNPDVPRHHRRVPPVMAEISHGDLRDSLSDTESLSTNCFVHNIESPSPTNIRSIQSYVYDRYTYLVGRIRSVTGNVRNFGLHSFRAEQSRGRNSRSKF